MDVSGNAAALPSLLAPGGTCAAYGAKSPAAEIAFGPSILKGIAFRFFIVYELGGWLEAGLVRHAVAARAPLAECAAAHRAVQEGKHIGNVVLDC